PGRAQQRPAYYDVIRKHADDTRWMALIDLDEFLVPVTHKTLPEFLRTLPRFSQLIVSWVDYGSNGHMEKPDGLVIENYTKHARDNWGVKSIINPRLITYLGNPHYNYVAGPTIDENGKKIGKVNQEKNPTTINKIRCNHYITKSHAEYIARCNLGDAGSGEKVKTFGRDVETNFRRFDKSEVYDPIMKKYVTKLKKLK
ncbi:MAG: glycosyltransferase family 92 protein, partial [Alphaproteobacteria bacterium]|nr:glycosyltransferase family 92 protein [Alphaproteobacteria bacterium]